MKFAALGILICAAATMAFADGRAALVIGNSSYKNAPLANPTNDASDVAAALKSQGFEVLLRTNLDYLGMEDALTSFEKLLKGKDTALFYYAGHGVQAENENYLIPVQENVTTLALAKSRGEPLADVLARIKDSGVTTALVFLDACRDNPFLGTSRSATRGLAAISAPRDLETLIAYATQPGDVAQDGNGRNGVFTGALLKNLLVPGRTVAEVMTQVKADVKAATGGKQQPRVDDGLSRAVYFNDPTLAAALAKAASDKSATELATLEAQLASLQAKLNSAKTDKDKQTLQVEQQRQQALQAAKKLEADSLAAEAARQDQLQQVAYQRQSAAQDTAAKQSELGNLAAARRAELDKLAASASSDNPDVLIDTVERLSAVLKEVDDQYAAALAKSLTRTNSAWDAQLKAIDKEEPDIVETDAEFALRQKQERAEVEAKRQAELSQLKKNAEDQRVSQTASMRSQFASTLDTLQTKVWTLSGASAKLTAGTFDRNSRTWPFTVSSADPGVPMTPLVLVAQPGLAADIPASIRALDAAVKANALSAEVDWSLTRQADQKRYVIAVNAVRVRSLTTNEVVVQNNSPKRVATFTPGQRGKPVAVGLGTLVVNTPLFTPSARVYIDGSPVGSTPLTLKLAEGTVELEVRGVENASFSYTASPSLIAGETTTVVAPVDTRITPLFAGKSPAVTPSKPQLYEVGSRGPAGGIVFYDKGEMSDGWRFLEVAPTDASIGIQWYNGSTGVVETDTKIGSGKANTEAIIAAQGSGSYAARLCRDLSTGGFTDWFLPSLDELNLLYTVLAKHGQGGFAQQYYWSSSQGYGSSAWVQYFGDGYRGDDYKNGRNFVRAVRAF